MDAIVNGYTTISLPDRTHRLVDFASRQHNCTPATVVDRAVSEWLERQRDRITEVLQGAEAESQEPPLLGISTSAPHNSTRGEFVGESDLDGSNTPREEGR